MYQTATVKQLTSDENIFHILDSWMKKYNTSPKNLSMDSDELAPFIIKWSYQTNYPTSKEDMLFKLRNWAIKKEKVIIVSSFSIIVLATSLVVTNKPITNTMQSTLLSNQEEAPELTSGIYYIDEKQETADLESEDETERKYKHPLFLPGSDLIENIFINSSTYKKLNDYMYTKIDNNPSASESEKIEDSTPIETFSIEEINPASDTIEPDISFENSNGIEIIIPSSVRQTGLCPNFTSYSFFYGKWANGTMQKKVAEEWANAGKPSANGIATLNDRYLVAVAKKFGSVGDNIDIVLVDGQVIPAIIADMKGVDATSEWGHVLTASGAVDIVEWEASGAKSEIDLGTWKNVKVEKIVNFGKTVESQVAMVVEDPLEEEKEYIQLYSHIYGLNENKIYQIISDMTSNFTSELYQTQNIIERKVRESKPVWCTSKEMAILLTIRNIYHCPEQYNVTTQDIRGNNLHSSNLSYAKQIEYLSNVLGVDTSLNYAICQASCGFDSPMFLYKHNPTHILNKGEYATFPTITAGFVEQTVELFFEQLVKNLPLENIGTRVADTSNIPLTDWHASVISIYNYVSKNYETIFGSKGEDTLLNRHVYVLS